MSLTPEELNQKIKDARAKHEKDPLAVKARNPNETAAGKAMRAATELAAALLVGGFLGYWLDKWLQTQPLFMILLFFAGFAAGFLNIYRAQTGQDFRVGMGELKPKEDSKDDVSKGEKEE